MAEGSCPGEEYHAKHIPPGGTLDISEAPNNVCIYITLPKASFSVCFILESIFPTFMRNPLLFSLTEIK
jgi:hypothetical protein